MSFAIYRAKNALLFWTTIFIFMTNSFIFYAPSVKLVKKFGITGYWNIHFVKILKLVDFTHNIKC